MMNTQMNVDDLAGNEFLDSAEDIDKVLETTDKDTIQSRKAARLKVEQRNELKELDKQLDSYYDSLLD